ncbi:TRAP transporter small permease [Oceaniglobus roseus]|uniref:TRAP transporter small permease n=1 Tax=Oceaniglobus roseus TaxID=1737570 RepID=UPI000C7F5AA5|nr:TRAP transporter small permease [Kandeliimicrobium roseum]
MHRMIERLARLMALLGGLVLVALVLLTVVSVAGRGLNTLGHSAFLEQAAPGLAAWLLGLGVGPVNGDFEIVEAGIAFAIFAFLPLCQLRSEHATVDVFTNLLPAPATRALAAFWEMLLALVILVIAWRLGVGFSEKLANGQTTFLLQFPLWWAYGASLLAAAVAALVAAWCAAARLLGRLPAGGGAGQ